MQTNEQASCTDGDLLDLAFAWGLEDGQDGESQRGSLYFSLGSLAYGAYNEGYAQGRTRYWSGGAA